MVILLQPADYSKFRRRTQKGKKVTWIVDWKSSLFLVLWDKACTTKGIEIPYQRIISFHKVKFKIFYGSHPSVLFINSLTT